MAVEFGTIGLIQLMQRKNEMEKLIIIDDDHDLLQLLEKALVKVGYQVEMFDSFSAVTIQQLNQADLLILDVMLPGIDGFSYLQQHREEIVAPVIFLTAKDFEKDLVEGFASGGDDYITKPFSLTELRMRVAAHLRREKRISTVQLKDGVIWVDLNAKQFFVGNELVELTAAEFEICRLLLQNKPQIFDKETIYTTVFGYDASGDSQTTITERIKNIRHKFIKLDQNPIVTVWGVGYRWQNKV